MKLPHCTKCGAMRANDLAEVAPCEECGAPPGTLAMRDPEAAAEPGWTPAELNRQRRTRRPIVTKAAP